MTSGLENQDEIESGVTEVEASNPNAAGPQGSSGDMGVSSERTGPDDGDQGAGVEGTDGTRSTARDDDPTPGGVEANTAELPDHDFDPKRNPGHSHG